MKPIAVGLWLTLLLVAGVDAAAPAALDPGWTASDWVLIISALTISATSILAAKRSGRTEAVIAKAVPIVLAQDAKLDALAPKLDAITVLVDPRLLQEIADLKRMFAEQSGRSSDRAQADAAQVKADIQQAKVAEAVAANGKQP